MIAFVFSANILWVNTYETFCPSGDCYDLTSYFSDLRDTLVAHGHTIVSDTGHVDQLDLSPYDIVIVCLGSNWYGSFTASEAHALAEFVRQGKGLLVMSENSGCPNSNLQALMDTFGFSAGLNNEDLIVLRWFNRTATPWGELFNGVDSLIMDAPGAVSGLGYTWLVQYNSNDYAEGACFGDQVQGAIIVVGDINMWAQHFNEAQDKTFFLNTVNFLAAAAEKCGALDAPEEPSLARLGLGYITLEPGAKAELYSPDGRLVGLISGPGKHRLPKGLWLIRVSQGGRSQTLKALSR